MRKTLEPLVLKMKTLLPADSPASEDEYYDNHLQIWICKKTGLPLVEDVNPCELSSSKFGETSITEANEGTDQSNTSRISSLSASSFGETSITKTFEGSDQSEVIHASRFGETAITRTVEGSDQSLSNCI